MRYALLFTISLAFAAPAFSMGFPNIPTLQLAGISLLPEQDLSRDFLLARQLVVAGRYAEAEPVLDKLLARTNSAGVRYLKGIASLGNGDPKAALRYLQRASQGALGADPGMMTFLALTQVQLGNDSAARSILADLQSRRERCGSDCTRAEPLDQAISLVTQIVA